MDPSDIIPPPGPLKEVPVMSSTKGMNVETPVAPTAMSATSAQELTQVSAATNAQPSMIDSSRVAKSKRNPSTHINYHNL